MKSLIKPHFAPLTVLATVIGCMSPLSPLIPQAQAAALEEVVVTAQRREQSLQDVAMSITAFTGDVLEMRVIDDIGDLQFSVPNLLSNGRGISIRGIANQSGSSTAEDGLGFHINDVWVYQIPIANKAHAIRAKNFMF